jgi:hypothetical protein
MSQIMSDREAARKALLERSPYAADGGELIGQIPFRNPLPLPRGAESPEGPSSTLPRLLLWQRLRGPKVCLGGVSELGLPHGG